MSVAHLVYHLVDSIRFAGSQWGQQPERYFGKVHIQVDSPDAEAGAAEYSSSSDDGSDFSNISQAGSSYEDEEDELPYGPSRPSAEDAKPRAKDEDGAAPPVQEADLEKGMLRNGMHAMATILSLLAVSCTRMRTDAQPLVEQGASTVTLYIHKCASALAVFEVLCVVQQIEPACESAAVGIGLGIAAPSSTACYISGEGCALSQVSCCHPVKCNLNCLDLLARPFWCKARLQSCPNAP